jgi:hypothetical protein
MTELARHPGVEETCVALAQLPTRAARIVYHLLSCPACLERGLALSIEEAGDTGEDLTGDWVTEAMTPASVADRLEKQGSDLAGRFEHDRKAAPALFAELMATPAPERGGRLEADRRLASPGLAERLLAAAAESAADEPSAAEERSRLALAIADRIPVERFGAATIARLRVAGWARLGEALRLQDDTKGAEAAFGAALAATEEVHVGTSERALYCHQLALLRRDQGRADEALGLLARAAEIHRGLGELPELGEVLAEKGRTLIDEDPRAALGPLRLAGELIPAATRPWPAARLWQALALAYADMGEPEAAERMLDTSRALAAQVRGRRARLLLAWADGEIAGQLGRTEEAAERLGGAWRGLVEAGRWIDAALAALDLAEVHAESGSRAALGELAREVEALLAPRLPAPAALASRVALRVAGRQEVATAYVLAHARQFLRRARGDAAIVFAPSREPLVTVAWDRLTASERREVCARVGVEKKIADRRAATIALDRRRLIGAVYQELTRTRIEWEGGDGG